MQTYVYQVQHMDLSVSGDREGIGEEAGTSQIPQQGALVSHPGSRCQH